MKILVSHTDLDGIGSIVLATHFNLGFDKMYSWDYGFENDPEKFAIMAQADELAIADLSMKEEKYDELAKGRKVTVYDHHNTSSWLSKKQGCVHDESRCGTKIFFEEYVIPRVPETKPIIREFANLVDAYDRWVLESPLRAESENLQRVWSAYALWRATDSMQRNQRFILQMCRKFEKYTSFCWNKTEADMIKKALDSENKAFIIAQKTIRDRVDSKGKVFGVWRAVGKISITASKLLRVTNKYDYVVCLQEFGDKWGTFSLRSREGDFEVTQLAAVGGHLAAGGATLTPELATTFWDNGVCLKYKDNWKEGDYPFESAKPFKPNETV